MRILTAEQMSDFDCWAQEELRIPVPVLMENAAIGVTNAVLERFGSMDRCHILCGPGNNGADGYAIARQLQTRGVSVACAQIGSVRSGSALDHQRDIWRRLGGACADGVPEDSVLSAVDVVIDALFGTGLSRPLAGDALRAVHAINGCSTATVSVDLPSGLDASHGAVAPSRLDCIVNADMTVSFARPKVANIVYPAAGFCGDLVIADLGVQYREIGSGPWSNSIDNRTVFPLLAKRPETAHKGNFGHVQVVAGSVGMAGAALLATLGTLRSGCGLVSAAVPAAVSAIGYGAPEAMTLPVGPAGCSHFAGDQVVEVRAKAAECSCMAVGPGLGVKNQTQDFVRRLLDDLDVACVIDADALRCFDRPEELQSDMRRVLTPHPGELARLMECSVEEIENDRSLSAREAARRSGTTVLLKGRSTIVAEPQGEIWINTTGGPLLAAGGSGDVLTGLIAGLLGQGLTATEAAIVGAFVHGRAGDRLAQRRARLGLGALAIAEELPLAMEECYAFGSNRKVET